MTRTTLAQRPQRAAHLRVRPSSEAVLVARATTAEEFLLNPTAFALWELCDGDTTVAEMVHAVCQLFAVTEDRAQHEVVEAVETMREVGLVT